MNIETLTAHEIAVRLKQWRAENDYSQRDAACVLKMSIRSLQNWEQERSMPQNIGLRALCRKIWEKRKERV